MNIGDPDSPYLTNEEAAEYLRFPTPRAFRVWAARHHLPAFRTRDRGRMLWKREILDAFVTPPPPRRVVMRQRTS